MFTLPAVTTVRVFSDVVQEVNTLVIGDAGVDDGVEVGDDAGVDAGGNTLAQTKVEIFAGLTCGLDSNLGSDLPAVDRPRCHFPDLFRSNQWSLGCDGRIANRREFVGWCIRAICDPAGRTLDRLSWGLARVQGSSRPQVSELLGISWVVLADVPW